MSAAACCECVISARMMERGARFSLARCEELPKRVDSGFVAAVRASPSCTGKLLLRHTALPRRYSQTGAQTVLLALIKDMKIDVPPDELGPAMKRLPVSLESAFNVTFYGGHMHFTLAPTLHHAAGGCAADAAVWSAMSAGGKPRVFCCPRSVSASDFVVAYFSEFMDHKGQAWHGRVFSVGDDGMHLGVADGGGRRVVFGRVINCRCVDAQDALRRPSILADSPP